MIGTVYLIHFLKKYRHCGHYIGWTTDLEARLAEHRKGRGARLLQVVQEAGIEWVLARTWEDKKRWFERNLKKRKYGIIGDLCPLCLGESTHVISLSPVSDADLGSCPAHEQKRPA